MEENVRSVCQGCHCECGVIVSIKDGKVTKVRGDSKHPMNKGFICIKGKAQPELLYHPDRVRYPLKRSGKRGEGKWEVISWDEALENIAEKLTRIKDEYGQETIFSIRGTGPRPTLWSTQLLTFALESPHILDPSLHICYIPSIIAEFATYGDSIMMEVGPDYINSKCIVVWGGNPLASHPPRGQDILEAKRKRNAKLIVIDPRRTSLAEMADVWLQVRPGTDDALALAWINIIINEQLYDKEFVNEWCLGFDELKKQAEHYPPRRVAEITWVQTDKIKEAARLYAKTKPAVLHHRVAIEHNINSTQTNRALAILVSLTGNVDIKGGNLLPMSPKGYTKSGDYTLGKEMIGAPSRLLAPDPEVMKKGIGYEKFPLASGTDAPIPYTFLSLGVEAILTGKPYPLKAAYSAGSNSAVVHQDIRRTQEALKKLELFIAVDFFMTPTAELADYVLPPATWLERDDICDLSYGNFICARQKVIEPLGECWHDLKIVIELAKRIPWVNRKYLPWDSIDDFNESCCKGAGFSFEELKEKGYITVPWKYKKYEKRGFETPTGKLELFSTAFEKYGYDPLPYYVEPPESPLSTPELINEYPLILITGSRNIEYFHSEGRQISSLRKRIPNPEIQLHPDVAQKLGLENEDWVWVETPQVRGERARFKVTITTGIHPRVVNVGHAWWFPEKPGPEHGCFDSNINIALSYGPPIDPVCGSVADRGTLCKVYK